MKTIRIILLMAVLAGGKVHAQNRKVEDSLASIYYSVVRADDMFIVNQGYRQALFDSNGIPVTTFRQGSFLKGLKGRFVFLSQSGQGYSELVDRNGRLVAQIPSVIKYVDTIHQRYRECNPGNNCAVYDADGNQLLYRANENKEFQYGLIRSTAHKPPYLSGVIDTLGNVIAPQRYKGIWVGKSMYAGMINDTAYVFNSKGKLLFSSSAHDVQLMHNKLVGIKLYGFWALKDSTGKLLTPFKYFQLKDISETGFIDASQTIIDAAGREVAGDFFDDIKMLPGGWRIFDSRSFNKRDVIEDDQSNILFNDLAYLEVQPIGPRFLSFSRSYSDKSPKIYDRYKKKFVELRVEEHLTGEVYIVDNNGWKQILKNDSFLTLPPFNNISRLNSNYSSPLPIYIFSKEQGEEGDNRYRLLPCAACERDVYGLLDTQANVILPMRYDKIEAITSRLIFAADTSGMGGVLLDSIGKKLYSFQGKGGIRADGSMVTGIFGDSIFVFEHTGRMLYAGKSNITPLFFGGSIPELLLIRDSLDNGGVFTLTGKQLLPYEYYPVEQKLPGLVSLKKNDSVYFINHRARILFGGRGFSGKKYFLLDGYLALFPKGGNWGIIRADGSTVLPFVYDTAGYLPYAGHFVGKDGKYALLNNTGSLKYALQDWMPSQYNESGNTVISKNNRLFRLTEGDPEPVTDVASIYADQFRYRSAVEVSQSAYGTISPGIYNRAGKKIASRNQHFNSQVFGNRVVISDSTGMNIAVIDSNGEFIMPFISKPSHLVMLGERHVALHRDGRGWLYYPSRGKIGKLSITADSITMKRLNHDQDQSLRIQQGSTIVFSSSRGKGIVTYNQILLDKHMQDIQYGRNYTVKRKGKWGILGPDLNYVYPSVCDSIAHHEQDYLVLVRDGKQGVYQHQEQISIPRVFDAIYNPQSLQNGYVVVKKDQAFLIVNKHGVALTPPLDEVDRRPYSLANVAAVHKGQEVVLSLDANGKVVVEEAGKEGAKRKSITGKITDLAIFSEQDKYGLYDNVQKKTILPALYDIIEQGSDYDRNDDHYIAWKYRPGKRSGIDSTIVVDAGGKIKFRLGGGRYPRQLDNGLWALEATELGAIVDESGKQIVADTFKDVELLDQRSAFLVMTNDSLYGIIDASGRYSTPPEFDDIENNSRGGYLIGYKGKRHADIKKYALISPDGEQLTEAVYDEVSPEFSSYSEDVRFVVQKGERYGVLDEEGREVVPCMYDSIQEVTTKAIIAKKGKWAVVSLSNTSLTPFIYDAIGGLSGGCISFRRGKLRGVLDYRWKEILTEE